MYVERGQRVVEHQDPGSAEYGTGQGEALALPTGEGEPLLADPGGQAPRQVVHEIGLRDGERGAYLVLVGVRPAQGEVLPDRHGEEGGLLEGDPDPAAQRVELDVADVPAVEGDPPGGDVVQPGHQRQQGRLAAAGGADDGQRLAGLDGQLDAPEHRCALRVAEPDLVEAERIAPAGAGSTAQRHRRRAVDDRGPGVEHLVDPVCRGHRLLRGGDDPGERLDRPDQHELQGHEGDQFADGQGSVCDGDGTGDQYRPEGEVGDQVELGRGAGEQPTLAGRGVVQLVRTDAEPAGHLRSPAECLDRAQALRRLLDQGGKVTLLVLKSSGRRQVCPGEPSRRQEQRYRTGCDQQSEPPVQRDQQRHHAQEGGGVDDQEEQPEGEEPPDHREVAGDPGEQLSGLPAVVEADVQPLQVGVEIVADGALHPHRRGRLHPAPDEDQRGLGEPEQQCQPAEPEQAVGSRCAIGPSTACRITRGTAMLAPVAANAASSSQTSWPAYGRRYRRSRQRLRGSGLAGSGTRKRRADRCGREDGSVRPENRGRHVDSLAVSRDAGRARTVGSSSRSGAIP